MVLQRCLQARHLLLQLRNFGKQGGICLPLLLRLDLEGFDLIQAALSAALRREAIAAQAHEQARGQGVLMGGGRCGVVWRSRREEERGGERDEAYSARLQT